MPDVIDSFGRARGLVEQLGATIPVVQIGTKPGDGGWVPTPRGHARRQGGSRGRKRGRRVPVGAVDWNAELLEQLMDADLPGPAADIAGFAWAHAAHAARDPYASDGVSRSCAASLAYWALTGVQINPESWRACDIAAAIAVLPFEDEQIDAPIDVDDTRFTLLMLEPTMPDRRD